MMIPLRALMLVALREVRLLRRSRATLGAVALLASVAWMAAVLQPLRRGSLGVASFTEMQPLQIALGAVILPLLALLAGAELFAGELAEGSLVPLLTLPISRRACFVGKCLGRGMTLGILYIVAFASVGVTVAVARGGAGWRDWIVVTGAGLLLAFSTGCVGTALGATGKGRVRAFGAALFTWVILVFALDALLLTLVIALAPPPPDGIGTHGHGEIAAPQGTMPSHDPHARESEPESPRAGGLSKRLMALSPVSLFRLTCLAASKSLKPRLTLALPGDSPAELWTTLSIGWLIWIMAPLAFGLRRFLRASLS